MAIFLTIVGVLIAFFVVTQTMAASQSNVMTQGSQSQVFDAVRASFIAKLHEINQRGDTVTVRPKYKRHAPTISVSVKGQDVSIWMSDFVSMSQGIIPLGRQNATWVARKKFKLARRIASLPSTQTKQNQTPTTA